ncbi:tripartite ATP-independent periplasmic transporter, dctM component domain-containing protein [Ditylenchus destructor]|uniref:Tripartite ATP-independent periplasmic transporter, dctM component domain-containing protein n=1 Tax=Ditylenchus destructor TaxID=166010 RepID=A0AAD4MHL1_9BILA|nr:tripartite ATP-independent periplasmic transporter, dctM component domain-containing protein [Ditylenchus destructor]
MKRAIDVFATLVLLFVVAVQTIMLFDKVRGTYVKNRADLRPQHPDLALLRRGLGRRRLRRAADRHPHLPAHLPSRTTRRSSRRTEGRRMSPDAVAVLGFVPFFVLMLLRVPVGMARGPGGRGGLQLPRGPPGPALKLVGQTHAHGDRLHLRRDPDVHADGRAGVGLGREPRALQGRQLDDRPPARRPGRGHRGGLRGFLRRSADRRWPRPHLLGGGLSGDAALQLSASFSPGVIAGGGTLGAILPPSTVLAVYAILTQQDIGKLFMAGIVPGTPAMAMYVLTIAVIVKTRPGWLPAARSSRGRNA